MRGRWLTVGLLGGLLAVPGAAGASTYSVGPTALGTGSCSSPANRCTIPVALDLVDDAPDADRIELAPGTYTDAEDRLVLDTENFDGLVVTSADPANPARLAPTLSGDTTPFLLGGASQGGQTFRNVILDGSNSRGATSTVLSAAGNTTFEDVEVISRPLAGGYALRFLQNSMLVPTVATMRRVRVRFERTGGAATSEAVRMLSRLGFRGSLTIEDSEIDVTDAIGGAAGIVQVSSANDVILRRSHIRIRTADDATPGVAVAMSTIGEVPLQVAVQDSAITGGRTGLLVTNRNAWNTPVTVDVSRTSVDAGATGAADDGTVDATRLLSSDVSPIAATVRDNALADQVGFEGPLALLCDSNAIFGAVTAVPVGSSTCSNTSTGTLGTAFPGLTAAVVGDQTLTAAQAHAAAWQPAAGSPVLDNATGIGASATDLAGASRSVDADDADCVAQVDRGAYEAQGLATPVAQCPVAAGPPVSPPVPPQPPSRVPAPVAPAPAAAAPVLGGLVLSPASPRRARARQAIVRFTADRAARVMVRLERRVAGRQRGKRCVVATRSDRRTKRCVRHVRVGTRTLQAKAGRTRLSLGSVAGRRTLTPGRYRITISARGATSKAITRTIRR